MTANDDKHEARPTQACYISNFALLGKVVELGNRIDHLLTKVQVESWDGAVGVCFQLWFCSASPFSDMDMVSKDTMYSITHGVHVCPPY